MPRRSISSLDAVAGFEPAATFSGPSSKIQPVPTVATADQISGKKFRVA